MYAWIEGGYLCAGCLPSFVARKIVSDGEGLLTEAQLELAKGDESFEKRAARFGVSL